MFTVTWLDSGVVRSVSHPTECVARTVYAALRKSGVQARFWNKDKALIC
jgi:hypothetical protein